MALSGAIAARTLQAILDRATPGTTTADLDDYARSAFAEAGAEGLFCGYAQRDSPPFPADIITSVNSTVVHGVPSAEVVLRAGDLLTVDIGMRVGEWCADHARSVVVGGGDANPGAAALVRATRGILRQAIEAIRPGLRWSSIARLLEESTHATGFGLVTDFVGHGIGRDLHEPPKVPCYWSGYRGPDFILREGMVLAIEPILTQGKGDWDDAQGELPGWRTLITTESDGWTVRTMDGSLAAHEEHTVAVTAAGAWVLTAL